MSDALQSVRDRVELAKPDLPVDPRNDLIVQEVSAADAFPVMQINLAGDIDLSVLKKMGEDLQEELEKIKGVLDIDLVGGIENEVQVDVDPEKLAYYDLALQDVQDAVALQNITIPGGKLPLGVYDYQVRVPGEVEDPEEMLGFVLNPGSTRTRSTCGTWPPSPSASRTARPSAASTARTRSPWWSRSGAARTSSTSPTRCGPPWSACGPPSRPRPRSASSPTSRCRSRTWWASWRTTSSAACVLVIVVLLAFFGFRNAVFVGTAIPFSMLITFIVLGAAGHHPEHGGAVQPDPRPGHAGGQRHRDRGEHLPPPRQGAWTRWRPPTWAPVRWPGAVIASTLTTVCAFGPIVFWPGIMGEFMKYLPITVIITLSASLLVALVFNPVLCARFMAPPGEVRGAQKLGDRLIELGLRTYRPTLEWALRHRFPVLVLGVNLLLVRRCSPLRRLQRGRRAVPGRGAPVRHGEHRRAQRDAHRADRQPTPRQIEKEVAAIGRDLKAYATAVGVPIDAQGGGGTAAQPPGPDHHGVRGQGGPRPGSSRDELEELRGRLAGLHRRAPDRREDGGGPADRASR